MGSKYCRGVLYQYMTTFDVSGDFSTTDLTYVWKLIEVSRGCYADFGTVFYVQGPKAPRRELWLVFYTELIAPTLTLSYKKLMTTSVYMGG